MSRKTLITVLCITTVLVLIVFICLNNTISQSESYKYGLVNTTNDKKIKETVDKFNNIELIPSIPRNELFELYKKIDVLVVPSLDDPMPVVATENFMFKNICLCSNKTGTSYYIKDGINGFVFDIGDEKQLENKIKYIVDNKDKMKKIKDNGRKVFEKYFEMNVFEKHVISIIEKN